MKKLFGGLSVLAAVVFIGCSDNARMTGPAGVTGPQPFEKTIQPPDKQAGQWTVDRMVLVPANGNTYTISGTIDYAFVTDQTAFSFTTRPSLTITNIHDPERETYVVSGENFYSGSAGKNAPTQIDESHKLAGSAYRLQLNLCYAINGWVQMRGVSITGNGTRTP